MRNKRRQHERHSSPTESDLFFADLVAAQFPSAKEVKIIRLDFGRRVGIAIQHKSGFRKAISYAPHDRPCVERAVRLLGDKN